MVSHEEELLPENTSGYKISQPKQTLAAYQQMGKSRSFLSFPEQTRQVSQTGQAVPRALPGQTPTTSPAVKRCKQQTESAVTRCSPRGSRVQSRGDLAQWFKFFPQSPPHPHRELFLFFLSHTQHRVPSLSGLTAHFL